MNENLLTPVAILFSATTLATLIMFFYLVKGSSNPNISRKAIFVFLALSAWLLIQAFVSRLGFYTEDTLSLPPRFVLLILPPVLTIILLFILPSGRRFMDSLPLSIITWINIVRIPVEITLYGLFLAGLVPELMTFTGRNFDILAGISAPFIAWYGFRKKTMSNSAILIWNFICLLLLLNIVINAALSAPFAFQQFGFDQPNVAVLNFPFSWLPCFIVPVVLFGHLVSIRRLIRKSPGV
jgi:hypothetical protein